MTSFLLDEERFRSDFASRDYRPLLREVKRILKANLKCSEVLILSVTGRIKDADSAFEKCLRKKYNKPFENLTDIVGLRIVVYLDSDVDSVDRICREVFEADDENCIDKRLPEEIKEIGYRALHFVGSMKNEWLSLPENKNFRDCRFEVQICSALAHTWSEIEHKKNYKAKAALPPKLQRRLYTLSGALELLDRELSQIAEDANKYTARLVDRDARALRDRITVSSVVALTREKASEIAVPLPIRISKMRPAVFMGELNRFGVKTNSDLSELLQYMEPGVEKFGKTVPTYLRVAMVKKDAEKYFTTAYRGEYSFTKQSIARFEKLLGDPKLREKVSDWTTRNHQS